MSEKPESQEEMSVFEGEVSKFNYAERVDLRTRVSKRIKNIEEARGVGDAETRNAFLDTFQQMHDFKNRSLEGHSVTDLEGFLDYANLQIRFYELEDLGQAYNKDQLYFWETVKKKIDNELVERSQRAS